MIEPESAYLVHREKPFQKIQKVIVSQEATLGLLSCIDEKVLLKGFRLQYKEKQYEVESVDDFGSNIIITLKNMPEKIQINSIYKIVKFGSEIIENPNRSIKLINPKILKRVLITGMPGSGKTTMAFDFYQKYSNEKCKFFINGKSVSELFDGYRLMALKLELIKIDTTLNPRQICEKVNAFLSRESDWLLVVDNVDNGLKSKIGEILPNNGNGIIIITSRNANWRYPRVRLSKFDEEEALTLIKNIVQYSTEKFDDELRILIRDLDFFPIAIWSAAHYLKFGNLRNMQGLGVYRDRFNNNIHHIDKIRKILDVTATGIGSYNLSALAALMIPINEILHKNDIAASQEARKILTVLPYLNPDLISLNDLRNYFVSQYFDDAIGILHRYGLIELTDNGEEISVHRLVQDVTRMSIIQEEKNRWYNRVFSYFGEFSPKKVESKYVVNACEIFRAHLLNENGIILNMYKYEHRNIDKTLRVLNYFINLHGIQNNLQAAIVFRVGMLSRNMDSNPEMAETCYKSCLKHYKVSSKESFTIFNALLVEYMLNLILRDRYHMRADLDKIALDIERIERQILELEKNQKIDAKEINRFLIIVQHGQARSTEFQARFDLSLSTRKALFEKALKKFESAHLKALESWKESGKIDSYPRELIQIKLRLARFNVKIRRLTDAKKYLDDIQPIIDSKKVDSHTLGWFQIASANYYLKTKDFTKSEKFAFDALNTFTELFSTSVHFDCADCYNTLARVYHQKAAIEANEELKKEFLNKSETFFKNGLDIYEKVYRKDHFDIYWTKSRLVDVLLDNNKLCEASFLFQDIETIRMKENYIKVTNRFVEKAYAFDRHGFH